jgi:hypothetical protein
MLAVRAAALLVCLSGLARAQEEVVDWRDMAQCVGHVCGVRGTVVATESVGPTYRLYFDAADHTARVLLMRGWLVTWPHYDGETIVATGKVDRFRDHVEMIVRDPSDVAVLDPTPTPPPSAAPTASPGELEQLRDRVRTLEQRIRQLEGR